MEESKAIVDGKFEVYAQAERRHRKLQKKVRKLTKNIEDTREDISGLEETIERSNAIATEAGERPADAVLHETTPAKLHAHIVLKINELFEKRKKVFDMQKEKNTDRNDNDGSDDDEDEGEDVNPEELKILLEEAEEKCDIAKKEIARAEELQSGLKERLEERLEDYEIFREVWHMCLVMFLL